MHNKLISGFWMRRKKTSSSSEPFFIWSEPTPNYLQVIWDEDLASFLDHGLWFQLLGRELAFAGVKQLLPRHAGQSQVGRVGLVSDRNLDGVRVNGARGVSGAREAWRKTMVFVSYQWSQLPTQSLTLVLDTNPDPRSKQNS